MYQAITILRGVSPYSQSRMHNTPFLDGESKEDYEVRTWREKSNADTDGIVFIPSMAFKQAIDSAARRLAIPDPDNKRATMTKYFISDVICEKHLSLAIHKNDMPHVTINANVDGVRGSGKRVPRTFPQVPEWEGTTSFLIMNEKIKPEMFQHVLHTAGMSIGVGQFRCERGGVNGRWEIDKIQFKKI